MQRLHGVICMRDRDQRRIPVMEIFGPTIQGEGMVIGKKTMFLRTGGCDYRCAWCDSAFTWNGEEKSIPYSATEVFNELMQKGSRNGKRNFNHVTISGGNPALVKHAIGELIELLHDEGVEVGLETQGSVHRSWFKHIDQLTISPKPPSSLMKTNWYRLDEIINELEQFSVNYSLKVVIFDDVDIAYAKKVHNRYPSAPFYLSVGNEDSEEGGDISNRLLKQLSWLWDKVIEDPELNDAMPLPQLHTLIWANMRGV